MVKLFPRAARDEFVDLVCAGVGLRDAAAAVGASVNTATVWWRQSGVMPLTHARSRRKTAFGASDHVPAALDVVALDDVVPSERSLTLAEAFAVMDVTDVTACCPRQSLMVEATL